MSINQRIAEFIDLKKLNPPEIYKELGVSRQVFFGWINSGLAIPLKQVQKFVSMYPELNARWLLVGSGTMLNENHYPGNDKVEVTEDANSAYLNDRLLVPALQDSIVTLKQMINDKNKIIELLERR